MPQNFKNYNQDLLKKVVLKKNITNILQLSVAILFILNILFALRFHQKTIIFPKVEYAFFTVAILLSFLLAFSRKKMLKKSFLERIKHYLTRTFMIFSFNLIIFLVLPAEIIYFYPTEYKTYTTEYKITTPGPSRGRHGRCKHGLKILDKDNNYHFFLCINLNDKIKYGTKAQVRVKETLIGSYLTDYKLFVTSK